MSSHPSPASVSRAATEAGDGSSPSTGGCVIVAGVEGVASSPSSPHVERTSAIARSPAAYCTGRGRITGPPGRACGADTRSRNSFRVAFVTASADRPAEFRDQERRRDAQSTGRSRSEWAYESYPKAALNRCCKRSPRRESATASPDPSRAASEWAPSVPERTRQRRRGRRCRNHSVWSGLTRDTEPRSIAPGGAAICPRERADPVSSGDTTLPATVPRVGRRSASTRQRKGYQMLPRRACSCWRPRCRRSPLRTSVRLTGRPSPTRTRTYLTTVPRWAPKGLDRLAVAAVLILKGGSQREGCAPNSAAHCPVTAVSHPKHRVVEHAARASGVPRHVGC